MQKRQRSIVGKAIPIHRKNAMRKVVFIQLRSLHAPGAHLLQRRKTLCQPDKGDCPAMRRERSNDVQAHIVTDRRLDPVAASDP
jgi:hypothetical protein